MCAIPDLMRAGVCLPTSDRSAASQDPRPLISWQVSHLPAPKNNFSPRPASALAGMEPAPDPEPDWERLRTYVTSCHSCSALKDANDGIWVPGTPFWMV